MPSGPRKTRLVALVAWAFFACAAAVLLAIAAMGSVGVTGDPPPPMPGQRVLFGGKQVHVLLQGTRWSGPTVVLESGLGGGAFAWAWVQPAVAEFARVVAYDRPGLGWSAQSAADHDANEIARTLHAVLERIEAPRPYLLVGHSLGGISVLRFAALYPDEVGGLVLVDAVSPQIRDQLDDYDYRHPWRVVAFGDILVRLGMVGVFGIPPQVALLPPQARTAANYFIRSPGHWSAMLQETAVLDRSILEARAGGTLGSIPLIVVSATRDRPRGWAELQSGLLALSRRHELRSPPATDHFGLVADQRQAAYTIQAIRDVYRSMGRR